MIVTYAVVTLYYSCLGVFMMIKTNVITQKIAPILVAYSILVWVNSVFMYFNFPYLPTIFIVDGLINSIQNLAMWAYIFTKIKIMDLKMMPTATAFAASALIHVGVIFFKDLSVPGIFIMNQAFGSTASAVAWAYMLIKSKAVSREVALFIPVYVVICWVIAALMLILNLPYIPAVYLIHTTLSQFFTFFIFISFDRYRLRKAEEIVFRS